MKTALRETQTLRARWLFAHRSPVTTPARHRQDRLQYIAPLSLARRVKMPGRASALVYRSNGRTVRNGGTQKLLFP